MRFDILTIFPNIFDSYFNESILARAQRKKLIKIKTYDIRSYTKNKHKKVDDKPYGGGAGMVLGAPPILSAVDDILKKSRRVKERKIILFSAKGKQFTQKMAHDWSHNFDQLILITGRYEGVDERVKKALRAEEVSIGPYVLTDGEIPAMVVVSAVSRLLPGVIRLESVEEESHWQGLLKKESGGDLEYPHYTRPEKFTYKGKTYKVPKVLLSGDHKKIENWRKKHRKSA